MYNIKETIKQLDMWKGQPQKQKAQYLFKLTRSGMREITADLNVEFSFSLSSNRFLSIKEKTWRGSSKSFI